MSAAQGRLNDFVVKIATANGTGSASANGLLLKAFFRMGIPVVGKNYFPSNIQGMPTWYEIRVTRDGFTARSGEVDLMIAMNAETYAQDVKEVAPGGYLVYDATWPRQKTLSRPDITVIGIPLAQMVNDSFANARVRILMKNMAYVGALAALVNIEMDVIRGLIEEMFAGKPKLIPANMQAIELGYNWVKENIASPLPLRVERLDKTKGHIMIDGNTAAGLGAVLAYMLREDQQFGAARLGDHREVGHQHHGRCLQFAIVHLDDVGARLVQADLHVARGLAVLHVLRHRAVEGAIGLDHLDVEPLHLACSVRGTEVVLEVEAEHAHAHLLDVARSDAEHGLLIGAEGALGDEMKLLLR